MSADVKCIVNVTRKSVICERALLARDPLRRMRGLMGRSALPAGEGVMLTPAPSIHTAFMRFPIDVVFLDRDCHVLRVVERLAPWKTASARRARSVLELAAGQVARRGIGVGDVLAVMEQPNGFQTAADVGRSLNGNADLPTEPPATDTDGSARVLLITTDRRFRAVAGTLFERRGCTVTFGERMTGAAQLARLERADVVVLDASASLTTAAREAAQIEALEPRVGVVMVAEDAADGLAAMLVIAKWDSFDALHTAVEDARAHAMQR